MEIAVWNWLLENLPAITGVTRVVKGFPSFARGALTAPSVALVMGTGETHATPKRIGSAPGYTITWLVMIFARDEAEKITVESNLRQWCREHGFINPITGDPARVDIRLSRGTPHTPQTDAEIERYAYALYLETDL